MKACARAGLVLAAALGVGGCASAPATGTEGAAGPAAAASAPAYGGHPGDPWEALNRRIFAFNDALDEHVLKPTAIAYRDAVPRLVRAGIDNVFSNIDDVWSAANHLMQGKVHSAVEMGFRVLTNTVFGIGGLFDPATEMRLLKRQEDLGQTLGRWGVGGGPYVVLPLFGPRTLRDSFTLLVDRQFDPDKWIDAGDGRWALFGLEVINFRTRLLETTGLIDQAALDRYSFTRDAYLARRLDQVYDGAPPLEAFDVEPDDAPPAAPPKP